MMAWFVVYFGKFLFCWRIKRLRKARNYKYNLLLASFIAAVLYGCVFFFVLSLDLIDGPKLRVALITLIFTKSNEWTGKRTFNGHSLHAIDVPGMSNPYEDVIDTIGATLRDFDDDNNVPVFGFGDEMTADHSVFTCAPNETHAGLPIERIRSRYREVVQNVVMAGPTSFAPLINQAVNIVNRTGQYHILVIIADGQVTRSVDIPPHAVSKNEKETIDAITYASNFPLSIVMVGVGDGPWESMQYFDDYLIHRKFDNFQFVEFDKIMSHPGSRPQKLAQFALHALMEIPEQYSIIKQLGYLSKGPYQFAQDIPEVMVYPPPSIPLPAAAMANHKTNYSLERTAQSVPMTLTPAYPAALPEHRSSLPTFQTATTSEYLASLPTFPASDVDGMPPASYSIAPSAPSAPSLNSPVDECRLNGASRPGLPPRQMSQAEVELMRLQDQLSCPVCLERTKDMVFQCGHETCQICATLRPSAAAPQRGRAQMIPNMFSDVSQVTTALRQNGLESCNLIVGIDFTKSNEWTGKRTFGGRSLHDMDGFHATNPYEDVIESIGLTLRDFDEDNVIPVYGFGDELTGDHSVFSFSRSEGEAGFPFEHIRERYREVVPNVVMAGPTSFAPIIYQAVNIVNQTGQYHILVIIADGQVTRPSDTLPNAVSKNEKETIDAITYASQFPLSIVMVGVGDGPWEAMEYFDDRLVQRHFDNFQFVEFHRITSQTLNRSQKMAQFALQALMEIPEQYREIKRLRYLERGPFQFAENIPDVMVYPTPMNAFDSAKEFVMPPLAPAFDPSAPTMTETNQMDINGRPLVSAVAARPGMQPRQPSLAEIELSRLQDQLLCAICLERSKDTVFQCGHETCHQCSTQITLCPACRVEIKTRIRRFGM
ncbi:hypothetical protein ATCC90586_002618 [Pythium insidiosum]|nr:hypothetical protein ATCC90586_002618 [Pythium insidiosum]